MSDKFNLLLVLGYVVSLDRRHHDVVDSGRLQLLLLSLLILFKHVLLLILLHHFLDSRQLRHLFRLNDINRFELVVDLVNDFVFHLRRWRHLDYLVLTERVHDVLEIE